ncbi:hypothetical protein N9N51_00025 [Candidatus Pelagibacter bacterium]|nr:hypothetical protein [Candidatus Pelagibacter bacterium]MDA8833000.1 hypothetical protein [Candidatus Pelagibacter bacterium]
MNKITLNTNHLVINALTAIKNKNYIEAINLLEKEFKDLKNILDPWLDEFNYKI